MGVGRDPVRPSLSNRPTMNYLLISTKVLRNIFFKVVEFHTCLKKPVKQYCFIFHLVTTLSLSDKIFFPTQSRRTNLHNFSPS